MAPDRLPPAAPPTCEPRRIRSAGTIRGCALLAALALLAAGCSGDGDYPRDWAPLRAPATASGVPTGDGVSRACPAMTGLYRNNDSVIYAHLIERKLTTVQRAIPWFTVEISGSTSDSLRAILATGTVQDTIWMRRGTDFDCTGGWLTSTWPVFLLRMWPPDSVEQTRGYESELAITQDTLGRLVGRVKTVSYRQVSVWCGDGCSYAKIPFTRKETVRWHRMSTDRMADMDGGDPMLDSATNAKLARENAGLEAGTPQPPNAMQSRVLEQVRRSEMGDPPR